MLLARCSARPGLSRHHATVGGPRPRLCVAVRAKQTVGDDNPFAGPATPASADAPAAPSVSPQEEARLELLEAQVRGNKRAIQAAKKAIPIKGMVTKEEPQSGNMAPWREGQLFPDGWDNMNPVQKVTELYMGRRGVLFWANKAAYASVFILLGGWAIFRFVGPNLGLYTLKGDLTMPPM